VEASYQEYERFARSGMEAARRAAYLRESALHGRTMRVFVMPIARKGTKKCHLLSELICSVADETYNVEF